MSVCFYLPLSALEGEGISVLLGGAPTHLIQAPPGAKAMSPRELLVLALHGLMLRRLFSIPPALRYPRYRAYWLGTLASVGGFQMLMFGQGWLTFELTGSPLYLGYIGLANATSAIPLILFGGVFADKLDKRRLIFITQLATALLIFLLAVLTLFSLIEVWHIILIAFVAGAVHGFGQPAHEALYPSLIDRKVMVSAVALDSAIWEGTRIVAPAVAGFVISLTGTATVFFLAGAGFVVMTLVILMLRVPRTEPSSDDSPMRDMVEGLKFISGNAVFSFLIGMTFFNSFFGMAYVQMMPAFAVDVLKVGANGQGVLMSMGGVGALAVTLALGSMSGSSHRGLMIVGGSAAFGLSIVAFALTAQYVGSFSLALALMLLIGTSSSLYLIAIMSSLQQLVPDNMRGRVMGFYSITWSLSPLGAMQVGAIAEFVRVPVAVAIGGALVMLFALGPATINRRVRNLSMALQERESRAVK